MAILSIHSRCILHENQSIFSREKQNEFTVLKLNNFFFLSVQSFLLLSFGASVVVIVPEFIFPSHWSKYFMWPEWWCLVSRERRRKKNKQTNHIQQQKKVVKIVLNLEMWEMWKQKKEKNSPTFTAYSNWCGSLARSIQKIGRFLLEKYYFPERPPMSTIKRDDIAVRAFNIVIKANMLGFKIPMHEITGNAWTKNRTQNLKRKREKKCDMRSKWLN